SRSACAKAASTLPTAAASLIADMQHPMRQLTGPRATARRHRLTTTPSCFPDLPQAWSSPTLLTVTIGMLPRHDDSHIVAGISVRKVGDVMLNRRVAVALLALSALAPLPLLAQAPTPAPATCAPIPLA